MQLDLSIIPRYDQGNRGTCMACAVCSLLGYYFHWHGGDVRLSPQHLYALCKDYDQREKEGTALETVFNMAKKHGVCRETEMPYNPSATPDNAKLDAIRDEMQTAPERLSEPSVVICRTVPFHRLYTPFSVNECKNALDGTGGYRPMPAVIVCTVFPSFLNGSCHNGWLDLPRRGEHSENAHAMLVVGYYDTPYSQDYKGYFLALNSWGPAGNGHNGMVKIPYEYYDHYVTVAGTIREKLDEQDTAKPAPPDSHGSEQDTAKPAPPDSHGSDQTTATVIHDEQRPTPPVALSRLADEFFASMKTNLSRPFFPLPYDLFQIKKMQWFRKAATVTPPLNESASFKSFIRENALLDHAPQATVNVFSLCPDDSFRVVAAVLSHDNGAPVSAVDIALLRTFIQSRLVCPYGFLSVAATSFEDDCHPVSAPPVVLCTLRPDGLWDYQLPQTVFSKESIDCLLHVLPGTAESYADKLAELIHAWPATMYITKDALRQKLVLHPSVPDSFLVHWLNALFARGGYGKDSRGYIYPPGGELPEGHNAIRVRRYE